MKDLIIKVLYFVMNVLHFVSYKVNLCSSKNGGKNEKCLNKVINCKMIHKFSVKKFRVLLFISNIFGIVFLVHYFICQVYNDNHTIIWVNCNQFLKLLDNL